MPRRYKRMAAMLLVALLVGLASRGMAYSYGSRSLRMGSYGTDVAELQRRLRDLGYLEATGVDGIFGPQTRAAVAAFQRDYGLVADGSAGRWTLGAVDRAAAAALAPAPPPPAAPSTPRLPFPWLPPALPAPPPPPARHLPPAEGPGSVVLGYYTEDWPGDRRSLSSLNGSLGQVNLIAAFQYRIDGQGNLSGREFPALREAAGRQGQPVLALIHNYRDGGFDQEVARQILATPAGRQRAVDQVVALIQAQGFAGVNVDLENIPPELRRGYTDFVARLQARLQPLQRLVTLSVPAKVADDLADGWSGAFDYPALAALADLLIIMAYDENSPGYPAGPVASVAWVERVVRYAASTVPPRKLLMGVAQYGYDWIKGTTQARALGIPAIHRLLQERGLTPAWDDQARVPHFTYTDAAGRERVVYYENAASLAYKLEIIRRYQLRGMALWKLGTEDPAIWALIREQLP